MCARRTNDNIRPWCRDRLLVPAPVPAGHYFQPIVPSHLLCTTLYSGLSIVIYTIYSIPLCFWILFTQFVVVSAFFTFVLTICLYARNMIYYNQQVGAI